MKSFFLFIILSITTVFAYRPFITDSFQIMLRVNPAHNARIIATPPSGTAITIIEHDGDWTRVREQATGRTGWMEKRYILDNRLPWELQYNDLQTKHEALRKQLADLNQTQRTTVNEKRGTEQELRNTTAQLQQITEQYNNLRESSSEYLALREKYEALKEEMISTRQLNIELREENSLLLNDNWKVGGVFAALLLLIGWIIAHVPAPQKKKRRI